MSESEVLKDAIALAYEVGGIYVFPSKAEKVYNQAKFME